MPSSGVQTCADRKSTRLNSSHGSISYAVFCLKKKKTYQLPALLYRIMLDTTCARHIWPPDVSLLSPRLRALGADTLVAVFSFFFFFLMIRRPPRSPLFPNPTLFR